MNLEAKQSFRLADQRLIFLWFGSKQNEEVWPYLTHFKTYFFNLLVRSYNQIDSREWSKWLIF